MATTEYDFSLDRGSVIESALSKVGALPLGKTPTGNQTTQAAKVLNSLLKSWQAQHRFQYTLRFETVDLVAADADYNMSTDPKLIDVEAAYFRDSSGLDQELKRLSYSDYTRIKDKDEVGQPLRYAVKFGATNVLYVHPVPNATDAEQDIYLLGIAAIKDADASSDSPDLQEQLHKALVYALAADLADDYALPLREREYLEEKARDEFAALIKFDSDRSDDEFVDPGI